MAQDFCVETGCDQFGQAAGYWQGRRGDDNPARPRPRLCRDHYLDRFGAEFVRFEVTGAARIVDVRTRESVPAPGVVELDPVATNIRMLVGMGYGRVVEDKPAGKPAGAKKA
ncbi:hypothetical protein GCM10010124_26180 [Pilimelia terevasa]|uniref:Uncharacterized protein n=1 Tax=Pilimelia terevasa TaxID=53372 RepID=A0A8J3BRR4_9ACTN|nr:hypothetical protein [Pilimelia terevasa]GGK32158.1 hypothetical protein GCM10010124_26180 [Pilimelia terevasa]